MLQACLLEALEADVRDRLPYCAVERVTLADNTVGLVASPTTTTSSSAGPVGRKTFQCVAAVEGRVIDKEAMHRIMSNMEALAVVSSTCQQYQHYLCFVDSSGIVSYYEMNTAKRTSS